MFSYFSDKGHVKSRIDFVFVSENLKAERYHQVPVSFSDHQALVAEILFSSGVRFGKGTWRRNTDLLNDEEISLGFVKEYELLVKKIPQFRDLLEWWDWCKTRISRFFRRKRDEHMRRVGKKIIFAARAEKMEKKETCSSFFSRK